MMTPSLLPSAINHLLASEPWARTRLAAHAGKMARIDTGIVKIELQVGADGLLEPSMASEQPAVTIHIELADLPLILQNRERAFSYVKIDGDADFANTLSQLSQSLRWDAEEDLSRAVGDIAARRIVSGTKATVNAAQVMHRKLAENLAEYFLEENRMLVRPQAVSAFTSEVTRLRDDLERLAKRIDRLTRGMK